jgi:3-hydroxyacyl-[acyl-carrier-protein] dehydratase
MSRAVCSPISGEIEVISSGPGETIATMEVDPGEPVLAGHYPDFPIFPGICLIEFAHRSAQSAPPAEAGGIELAAVDRARFLSPVYPGDRLEVSLSWALKDGDWRCSAKVSTDRSGKAAQLRLRYREVKAP